MTEEYKRLTGSECAAKLLTLNRPLVVCHARPDGDAVGSMRALAIILRKLGKDTKIACADPIPQRLVFILGDESLTEDFEGRDVVTVDVASPSQLGSMYDRVKGKIKLSIDHHRVNTPYSDNYTVPEASSTAEAIMDVLYHLTQKQLLQCDRMLAEALYTAISSDTGCFCYSNATAVTHSRAAELLSYGIDSAGINHLLFHTKSEGQLRAEGFIGSTLKVAYGGAVAYATLTDADRLTLGINREDAEGAIDVVRSLAGVKVAFTVKEQAEGSYRVSLRSTGPDVAAVAASFGGGGHTLAAGCSVSATSAQSAAQAVLSALSFLGKQNL